MSVFECICDVFTTVHEICSMGCDVGFAGARGSVRGQTRDVHQFTSSEMAGRRWRQVSGQVGVSQVKRGEIFPLVLVVVTHLHQFLRVWHLFPAVESSLRCSSTTLTDD